MTLRDEWDLLDEAESETRRQAGDMEFASDVDRRQFVFLSLAAAAATTFGYGAKALAQPETGARGAQPAVPPVPLDNMEPVSWTFQPYPGGIGALLEKTYREKGVAAFARQPFAWNASTRARFSSRHGAPPHSPPPTRRLPTCPRIDWPPPSRRASSPRCD